MARSPLPHTLTHASRWAFSLRLHPRCASEKLVLPGCTIFPFGGKHIGWLRAIYPNRKGKYWSWQCLLNQLFSLSPWSTLHFKGLRCFQFCPNIWISSWGSCSDLKFRKSCSKQRKQRTSITICLQQNPCILYTILHTTEWACCSGQHKVPGRQITTITIWCCFLVKTAFSVQEKNGACKAQVQFSPTVSKVNKLILKQEKNIESSETQRPHKSFRLFHKKYSQYVYKTDHPDNLCFQSPQPSNQVANQKYFCFAFRKTSLLS